MMSCPCCGKQCCCSPDGTITEIAAGQSCDGTTYPKAAEPCNWDDVTITFTVCGLSATASASDWATGIEPAFTAGQGNGQGDATGTCLRRDNGFGEFTSNRFTFHTSGNLLCECNLRSIEFFITVDYIDDQSTPGTVRGATCFYDLTINECLNEIVLAENATLPDGQCCPDACVIECEVNWAP